MAESGKGGGGPVFSEDSLIARHFRPLAAGFPGALDLRDDAASFGVPEGSELVVTTDALIAGVHFFADDAPADIAFKALAVNVSDLAAKAAAPLAYSIALALPRGASEDWIAGFAGGLGEAQAAFGIALSGGDTTVSPNGPLMVAVTAFGSVPAGRMVRRGGAQAGDHLYVSGSIGDAALGLALRRGDAESRGWPLDEAARAELITRYLRPAPRLALRAALLAHASAAMDVSDGLAIDCARLCAASGVDGRIEAASVPLSAPAQSLIAAHPALLETALTGGDDYEILAAIPEAQHAAFSDAAAKAGIRVTRIGAIGGPGGALTLSDPDGRPLALARTGYDHLAR
ncbi:MULTISPECIES: thiamine-phosphate kinase [Rhodomicrobium]|uniref:thiamine-phosphate kinase n=1 Tax=Rhodomicrobium TaxID=1068 RepID=UPI000B4BFB33|nr:MULTISPECIES: thiamine-phosphate kinase [Rhodomicrobium]